MKVCIFGAGGVGAYFGARLLQANIDVTFIARGQHLAVMRSNGLKVSGISGEFSLPDINAVEHPKANSPYDLVILAVKAWQVKDAAKSLLGALSKSAIVVPLQNGVEAPDDLAEVLGDEPVTIGLCGIVSLLKEPGHVFHAGVEPFIKIGERNGSSSDRVDKIVALLNRAEGINASNSNDIRIPYWQKFMFIVTMSGIGSVTRAPIGVTRENEDTRKLMEACAREVYLIACAQGIPMPSDSVEKTMITIDGAPADATASMQRDVASGKPSELYNQNVAVTRLGKAVGVATPVNEFIGAALQPQEKRARGNLKF